jgi:hypothetical protein
MNRVDKIVFNVMVKEGKLYGIYTSVLYDCYALHQYGSKLSIKLITDVFVELPDQGPVRTETCSSH